MTTAASDDINGRAWQSDEAVHRYLGEGFSDRGERAAFHHIAAEMKDARLLDIGVGAGRTVPLLTAISGDYLAIDYTQRLVELCRRRHAGRRIELMDARDLSALADASFDTVVFSFNGIDAAGMPDRARILAEIHRVLRPGGVFLFSTHNRASPACGEKPWSWYSFTANPLKLVSRTLTLCAVLARDLPNYLRHRALNRHGEGWSTMVAAAHHFGVVIVYIDLEAQRRLLDAAGFDTEAVYGNETGLPLRPGDDTVDTWWFQIVARKRS